MPKNISSLIRSTYNRIEQINAVLLIDGTKIHIAYNKHGTPFLEIGPSPKITMDNIITLHDVTHMDIDPDRVLRAAVGKLETVVICGYDKDGNVTKEIEYKNGEEIKSDQ